MMKNKFNKTLKARLMRLLKKEALHIGNFVLSSGKSSSFYIDGRCITLTSEGAYLTACLILDLLKKEKIGAIGGPTLGADPIVGAICAMSFVVKHPIKTFIIRKQPKLHGTRRQIEGPNLKKGSRVVLVDDVATSGKSFCESIDILRSEGLIVDTAVCIVDRYEGAKEALLKKDCKLISIFTPLDFGISV